jgi:CO dehydrogenase/acetyl-CoA synthase delta subunit
MLRLTQLIKTIEIEDTDSILIRIEVEVEEEEGTFQGTTGHIQLPFLKKNLIWLHQMQNSIKKT